MLSLLLLGDGHWAAVAATLLACLVLAWRVLSGLARPGAGAGGSPAEGALDTAAQDYPDLGIPQHPHLEMAMDPPTGLQWSNPREPYTFENELCSGTYIAFHPPTCPGPEGSGSLNYRDYFSGKKRMWELRVSLRFKRPPPTDDDMFFGIELESFVPMSEATKRVASVATAALRKVAGTVYQSFGDDPGVARGECERPTCVLPLWAFDQFVETPEGEEPPSLTDVRFPGMGHKRYQRVGEYAQEVEALRQSFRVGPCYTFALWGPTRFLDAINWRLVGIPLVTPLDFDRLAGAPPVHAVLYALRPSGDSREGRHLVSRKQYLFRAAIWSSNRRPCRERFESLTGAKMACEGGGALAPCTRDQKLRRKLGRMRKAITAAATGSVNCCMATARKDASLAADL